MRHPAPSRLTLVVATATLLLTGLLTGCLNTQATSTGTAGWLDPWQHRHSSPRGTPLVHPIGMEPAFLGRDLLFTYAHHRAGNETEDEVEAELEWALTNRLGVAVELPLGRVSESGGETHTGVGDLAIAPRALLVTTDRFLASVSVGVTVPTGDSERGLGSGEASLGPALSTWGDLGDGLTLQTRIGTGHGLETGDVSLDYHAALIWTLGGADDRDQQQHQHQHHPQHHGATEHLPPGMISLLAEFGGGTVLDGPRMDGSTAEVLLGVGYAWDTQWEVRGAVLLPVVGPSDVDPGVVVEAILHF